MKNHIFFTMGKPSQAAYDAIHDIFENVTAKAAEDGLITETELAIIESLSEKKETLLEAIEAIQDRKDGLVLLSEVYADMIYCARLTAIVDNKMSGDEEVLISELIFNILKTNVKIQILFQNHELFDI